MSPAGGWFDRSLRARAVLIAGLLGTIGGITAGCTHVMYNGPRHRASEVAFLKTSHIDVDGVDGRDDSGSRFEFLPGNHTIQYRLNAQQFHVVYTTYFRSGTVSSCVKLKAGHRYALYAVVKGQGWETVLLDQTMHRSVVATCGPDEDED